MKTLTKVTNWQPTDLKKKKKRKKYLENLLIISQIIKQTNKNKQTKTSCFVTPKYIYT